MLGKSYKVIRYYICHTKRFVVLGQVGKCIYFPTVESGKQRHILLSSSSKDFMNILREYITIHHSFRI